MAVHRTTSRRRLALFAPIVAVVLLASCTTTRNERFVELDGMVREGEFGTAVSQIEDDRDDLYGNREQLLFYLDTGMLYFYDEQFDESIRRFHEAERLIEELFTRSITQAAATFLLNDNAQDYSGEDFEDIYLNVFKAASFIEQGNIEGAFVEVRRINNKLNLLEDKYRGLAEEYNRSEDAAIEVATGESRFFNSALARYLSLVMYRAEGDFDSARIDWQEIQEAFAAQANLYDFPIPFDDTVIEPADGARLSVLSFVGEAPLKRADALYIITLDNAVQIVAASEGDEGVLVPEGYASFFYPGIEGGYTFNFELPRMELRGSDVERIRVVVDGRPLGDLRRLEDIERIAVDTFEIRRTLIFIKTVTRTIVKGIIAQQGTELLEEAVGSDTLLGGAVGLFGSIAAGVAVDASEEADLRVSRYFPAYAYVGEWDIPAGTYDIEIEYFGARGLLHVEDFGRVLIEDDGLNFLSSSYNN